MITFIEKLDKAALVGKNVSLTYKDLLNQIDQYAALLRNVKNKKAVIFSENRPEWIFALYAVWKQEGTVVPVDVFSAIDDVAYILSDCNPEVVFCSAEKYEFVVQATREAGKNPEILIFEKLTTAVTEKPAGSFSITDTERTALILYTSGTTGHPKGVMLSFENILTNLTAVCHDVPIFTVDERVMILLPFHHILPLVGSIVAPLIHRWYHGFQYFSCSGRHAGNFETIRGNYYDRCSAIVSADLQRT